MTFILFTTVFSSERNSLSSPISKTHHFTRLTFKKGKKKFNKIPGHTERNLGSNRKGTETKQKRNIGKFTIDQKAVPRVCQYKNIIHDFFLFSFKQETARRVSAGDDSKNCCYNWRVTRSKND